MKAKLYLDVRKSSLRKNGFPIVVSLNMKGKRKLVTLKHYSFDTDWDFDLQQPLKDKRLLLYVKKKRLRLDELVFESQTGVTTSLESVKRILLGQSEIVSDMTFYEFFNLFISELIEEGRSGNAAAYKTAKEQLQKFRLQVEFSEIDYSLLQDFKHSRIALGNSKNTIHTYLRKYRAVYNEAVRRKLIKDQQPFVGVFKGITVKSNRTKKKHISKDSIRLLENLVDLPIAQQRAVDLWLLQFYFAGQDLMDIYNLETNKIQNGRVFFQRGKLGEDGYQFDLKIVPKADKILNKYRVSGEFVFPWRKDYAGYITFRNNMRRSLHVVQEKNKIEILPLGGKLGSKVARHTFATIGKQLSVETDLLRELMGHERNDVDTIYKDKYPEETRDAAHLKIID